VTIEKVTVHICAACRRMTDDWFTVTRNARTFDICYPCWMGTPLAVVESEA